MTVHSVEIETLLTKIDPRASIYHETTCKISDLRKALDAAEAAFRAANPDDDAEPMVGLEVHARVEPVPYEDNVEAVIDEVSLSVCTGRFAK